MTVVFYRFVCFLSACFAICGQEYVIETLTGAPVASSPVRALNTALPFIGRVALDKGGNVYFHGENAVFKLTPDGMMIRFAGTTQPGYDGDNGPANSTRLYTDDEGFGSAAGVAVDAAGNVYIADSFNARVRKVSRDGSITTVAGNGKSGFSGDGGRAVDAQLWNPSGLALDGAGNLYIADAPTHRVRRVSADGIITTVAGNGTSGSSGDGGLAVDAQLAYPIGVAVRDDGNLFIADVEAQRVRRVSPSGAITTVAGNGAANGGPDGVPAAGSSLRYPVEVAVDSAGNVYVLESNRVRQVTADGTVRTVVDNVGPNALSGMAIGDDGVIYFAGGGILRKVSPGGAPTAVAGNGSRWYGGDGGPVSDAQLYMECCGVLTTDSEGALYIADAGSARIRKVSTTGVITTVAGTDSAGFSGDGGAATNARLMQPRAVAWSRSGDLFIADGYNYRIRRVSRDGIITTVAGNGVPGQSGDGGDAKAASIGHVFGLAVDGGGNVYFSEVGVVGPGVNWSQRIRKVSSEGIISTIAESNAATPAERQFMALGVAVDEGGNVYFTDHGKHRVLRATQDGILSVFAGTGKQGTGGEGGPARQAELDTPIALAAAEDGSVYIGEAWSPRLRRVTADGVLTTIAGTGVNGHSGDGGPATRAAMSPVAGIAIGPHGEIYTGGFGQGMIRVLRPAIPGR